MILDPIARCVTIAALSIGIALAVSGCGEAKPDRTLIKVPNTDRVVESTAPDSPEILNRIGIDRGYTFLVPGSPQHGAGAAALSVWVVDPAPHTSGLPAQPAGTLFLIHDRNGDKSNLVDHAQALADAGFRVVLADSRGHGNSQGQWATYGLAESIDMKTILDRLYQEGEIVGKVGVYGQSYGGATALHWAAKDKRVRAVVCVSTFTTIRDTLYEKRSGLFKTLDELLHTPTNDQRLRVTGQHAGFDPYLADNVDRITHVNVPVLLIHGQKDSRYPLTHAHALANSANAPLQFITIPDANQKTIYTEHAAALETNSGVWFGRWLSPNEGQLVEN